MNRIICTAEGDRLSTEADGYAVSGSSGTLYARFLFDSSWTRYAKTVMFYCDPKNIYRKILPAGSSQLETAVPSAAIKLGGRLFIALTGTYTADGTVFRRATNITAVPVVTGGYADTNTPEPPEVSEYEQMLSMMNAYLDADDQKQQAAAFASAAAVSGAAASASEAAAGLSAAGAESSCTSALAAKSAAEGFAALAGENASLGRAARDAAEEAEEGAETACVSAEAAKSIASAAAADAAAAKNTALGAKTAAEAAQSAAEAAQGSAEAAEVNAGASASTASAKAAEAAASAVSAQSSASSATASETAAETAQTTAQAAAEEAVATLADKPSKSEVANAVKGTLSGTSVSADDVSPLAHNIGFVQYGQCEQSGTPAPDAPVAVTEGRTAGGTANGTVTLTVKDADGNDIVLCGLPVSGGGNVTIGAQRYIADTVMDSGNVIRKIAHTHYDSGAVPQGRVTYSSTYGVNIRLNTADSTAKYPSTFFSNICSKSNAELTYGYPGAYTNLRLHKEANITPETVTDDATALAWVNTLGDIDIYYVRTTDAQETATITPSAVPAVYPEISWESSAYTEVTYNRDINAIIQNLTAAVISLGGNI